MLAPVNEMKEKNLIRSLYITLSLLSVLLLSRHKVTVEFENIELNKREKFHK